MLLQYPTFSQSHLFALSATCPTPLPIPLCPPSGIVSRLLPAWPQKGAYPSHFHKTTDIVVPRGFMGWHLPVSGVFFYCISSVHHCALIHVKCWWKLDLLSLSPLTSVCRLRQESRHVGLGHQPQQAVPRCLRDGARETCHHHLWTVILSFPEAQSP